MISGITMALCGALDGDGSNNYFLAIDRLLSHQIPHFLNSDKVKYLCRDIMSREIQAELAEMVRYHSSEHGRTCILVGMHLCGLLSEKAIEFFARMPEVRGLVLSPCCLPRRHEQGAATRFVKAQRGDGDPTPADLHHYLRWVEHLRGRVGQVAGVEDADVRLYRDDEMHSEKNAIILGLRRGATATPGPAQTGAMAEEAQDATLGLSHSVAR